MAQEAWLLDLGTRDYAEVWAWQKELVQRRARDEIPDVLMLVEHPHVITLGRRRRERGLFRVPTPPIPVYEVERGGEATYHGPGQLVGYPIVKLEGARRNLHRYLRDLEELLIQTLRDFGLPAQRRAGATGVWTRDKKIASIGIAVQRWVTYHGFALNVSPDLRFFQFISPCGFDGSIMTSLERELSRSITMAEVKEHLRMHWENCFQCQLRPVELLREVPDVKMASVSRG